MVAIIDYRGMARHHAKRAADLLTVPAASVAYVAVELRMAIEAIAYGRLQDYIDDIPPRRLNEWQAPKVLETVACIDPGVAYTRRLMVEVDAADDEKVWVLLGEDKALSMKSLQGNYHALGNFLHTPTIGQLRSGKIINLDKQVAKCRAILEEIDSVLAIENWSFSLAIPYDFQCMREGCSSNIRRRMNAFSMQPVASAYSNVVECFECAATYDVMKDGKNAVLINPQLTYAKCQNDGCGNRLQIWHSDVRRRDDVTCHQCGATSKIVLGMSPA
ncbi:hypothetical protein ASE85_07805 [Sphingobium sp. Leaf26]|uniref:hypothetical protein n=1 Tax=Sphingobium sp. Leaf26 TaxID=1735693 RepID=UPI00070215C5|nr:hypothetical protein [Sphingobium sp. Leaf26]KQN04881.1 hypothetical protein ASE85_07805 [Sphingobium sp. Leaf26]